jgi:hypothetical protein
VPDNIRYRQSVTLRNCSFRRALSFQARAGSRYSLQASAQRPLVRVTQAGSSSTISRHRPDSLRSRVRRCPRKTAPYEAYSAPACHTAASRVAATGSAAGHPGPREKLREVRCERFETAPRLCSEAFVGLANLSAWFSPRHWPFRHRGPLGEQGARRCRDHCATAWATASAGGWPSVGQREILRQQLRY